MNAARLWLAACLLWAALPAAGAGVEWLDVEATAELVDEPVFNGRVMLYRAGRRGAEPVVLVHGLGQNGARDWSRLIPALAARYDVFALDLPGFGASDKGNHLYSPENYVRVIDAVISPRVSRPVALIGHSMGAAVSLAYAAAYPDRLGRLILVDMAGVLQRTVYAEFLSRLGAEYAVGFYPEDAPWFDSMVRTVLTKADSLPASPALLLNIPALRQKIFRGDPNSIAAFALVDHDFSRALRRVSVPTLLVWGSEDKVAPLRTGQAAAATIPGARLAILHGAGHSPQLQLPDQFNTLVLKELSGKPQGRAVAPDRTAHPEKGQVATCDGESGRRFSGDYRQVILNRCADARIEDADIGVLVATDSRVEIVNSRIRDGVNSRNSRLVFTGGSVEGSPALALEGGGVDAAGTRFESDGPVASNRGPVGAVLHLSVSEIDRGRGADFGHEVVRLKPDSEW